MSSSHLIDTHILLWYAKDDPRLSTSLIDLINDLETTQLISKASLWELTIKSSLGKLDLGVPFDQFAQLLLQKGFVILDFDFIDLRILHTLPYHHNDPFDRLIIAQAIARSLPVISDDRHFPLYPVQLISG